MKFKVVGFKLSTKSSGSESAFEFRDIGLTLSHVTLLEGTKVNVYVKFPEYLSKNDLMVAVVTKSQPSACLHQLEFPTGSILYCDGSGVVDCIANLPFRSCGMSGACCGAEHDKQTEKGDVELDSDSTTLSAASSEESNRSRRKVVKSIEKSSPNVPKSNKSAGLNTKNEEIIYPGFKREFSSGLKYEVISISKNVNSSPPQIALVGSKVNVKYEGRLAKTGKKFDSGNLSFTVGSGQVVPGFDQGVKGMIVSETRRVFIPSKLGYGPRGCPPVIPKNADLVFEITLLNTKH